MPSYVVDSALFRDQFSTAEMREIFSDERTVQSWLDVEAALARVQADLGMIPDAAARAIAEVADVRRFDLEALKQEMDRTAHPIVPLVRAVAERCAGDLGQWVHYGATTQDIVDTGMVLQMRDAWKLLVSRLEEIEAELARLARAHRDTPMAGRTHGQQAQPVTFGYKCAVWLAAMFRHRERFGDARARLFMGQIGGAVGTLAAMGSRGLEVREGVCEALGLAMPDISWHTARDGIAEFAFLAGLAAASAGQIAHEIYTLGRSELAEVEEPHPAGKVGSSTMPHKRNPAVCETVVALARTVRGGVSLALEGVMAEHERDKIGLNAEREWLARVCCQTDAALAKTRVVLAGLTVREAGMRRNLELSGGAILSEAVMMRLAGLIGRQRAHDALHRALMRVHDTGGSVRDALLEIDEVRAHVDARELDELLDASRYTGLAGEMVDRVLRLVG